MISVLLSAGCLVDVSYEGTAFRCDQSPRCPEGLACVDGRCRPPLMDASVDAPPDAPDCPAADADGELTAFRAPAAIAVDGSIEAAWDGARSIEFANAAHSDNTCRVRVLWDDTNLYFLYEVTDDLQEAISEPGGIFRDDGSEIYLDMAHDQTPSTNGDDVHFIANIDEVVQSGTMEVAAATGQTSYVMEHALSWAEVGQTPAAGDTVGLLFGNNDRDNDVPEQYDWRGLIDSGSYTRPNLWGDLHVSDLAAGICP